MDANLKKKTKINWMKQKNKIVLQMFYAYSIIFIL